MLYHEVMSPLFFVPFIIGVFLGIFLEKNRSFKKFYNWVLRRPSTKKKAMDRWSIGIYEGSLPFDLAPSKSAKNPVISARDITDVDALFVADPFMIQHKGKFFMFFEVMDGWEKKGLIGYAESSDAISWCYKGIVLNEPFHLSYPYVFEHEGQIYMMPESHRDVSVRLYRASSFPDKWEYQGDLLRGFHIVDPSLVYHNGMWWLFAAIAPDNGVLNLFYSKTLHGRWQFHPRNPIVRFDPRYARPAGRIIKHEGKLYRFAQDCSKIYGSQVFAFEIEELSESDYRETMVSPDPLIKGSGKGWNALGMHHIDLKKLTPQKWVAAVDGRRS